jgi:hypothetical protein
MAPVADRRRRRRRDRSAQLTVLGVATVAGMIGALTASPHIAAAANPVHQSAAALPSAPVVPPRTLLFGHVGPTGRLDLLVAFGWDGGGRIGTAMLIPPTTLVEVPALGQEPLSDVTALASPALLPIVLANALDLRFSSVALFNDAQLASVFAAAGPFDVDFPIRVQAEDGGGSLVFNAGVHRIQPSDAVRLLVAQNTDALTHLVTVGAVLDGWRHKLTLSMPARATIATDRRVLPLVIRADAAVADVTLPVDPLSSGAQTRYELRQPDATQAITQAFPAFVIGPGPRPRVELLNGVGDVGVTQQVAARVVPAGAQVTLTGNVANFGVRTSLVVYYDPSQLAAAKRLAAALGVGRVAHSAEPIGVADITIVVGKDFTSSN